MINLTANDIQRFWFKVNKKSDEECWEWSGKTVGGYGIFILNKSYNLRRAQAHRISWIIHYDQIPHKLLICHHCDNPSCVNPKHLFLGTQDDNMKDMARKGRGNTTRGENKWSAKLSESNIIDIRNLYQTTNISQAELGRKFGVTRTAINHIIHYKKWKHIE